jgi:hypothetical protein
VLYEAEWDVPMQRAGEVPCVPASVAGSATRVCFCFGFAAIPPRKTGFVEVPSPKNRSLQSPALEHAASMPLRGLAMQR